MAEMMICPKAGDRVRVLGVHKADSFSNNTVKGKIGIVGHDFTPQAQVEHGYFRGDIILDGENSYSYFYAVSIELIQGETMKQQYKSTTKRRAYVGVYGEVIKDGCSETVKHYTDLIYTLQPLDLNSTISFDHLIAWAKHDPKRITWLLEKGYIEKVESKYDRWVDECPFKSCNMGKNTQTYIEWAKRMPK